MSGWLAEGVNIPFWESTEIISIFIWVIKTMLSNPEQELHDRGGLHESLLVTLFILTPCITILYFYIM